MHISSSDSVILTSYTSQTAGESISDTRDKSAFIAKCERRPSPADITITPNTKNLPSLIRSLHTLIALETGLLNTAKHLMESLKLNANSLSHISGLLQHSESGDRPATDTEIKAVKKLHGKLIKHISTLFSNKNHISLNAAKKLINSKFKDSAVKLRNNNSWEQIQTHIEHNKRTYISTLVPAGKMKIGDNDIFQVPYQDKSVCSASTKETRHATNLWTSEIAAPDHNGNPVTLFKGVRHGILSPFGLSTDDAARREGSLSRAKEVITAALYAKPELLEQALSGEEISMQIVSTALVTPGRVCGEDEMLKDQMFAWQSLTSKPPICLSIRDAQGALQQIKVNLNVAAFNFGVNEMALKFGQGWSTSDKYNTKALSQLLGSELKSSSPPGGMVGEYLKSNPGNRARVIQLSQQLKSIIINNSHHHDGGEPYKAAQRVAMLAYEIGAIPCWNCKSGKDRTGMLDTEIKREVISQHQKKTLTMPRGSISNDEKELFQKVLIQGGNAEIQAYNTGAAGNKVIKKMPIPALNLSYERRISNSEIWNQAQGFSRLV